jgi:hypothetical protein
MGSEEKRTKSRGREIEMDGGKEGRSASLEVRAAAAAGKLKASFEILRVYCTVSGIWCTVYGIQSVRTVGICFQLF